jgi:hypothetical protein
MNTKTMPGRMGLLVVSSRYSVSSIQYSERESALLNHIAIGAKLTQMNEPSASLLRENTGTTGLAQTARTAAETLAHYGIPHLIIGGLAVQEHGYPRMTIDVDMVVPDVLEAVEFLTADLSGPFARLPDVSDRLVDRRNQVKIDLLPAGRVVKRGCKVPFPNPPQVSGKPQIATLEDLVSLKLDSWSASPTTRLKDKADVVELIKYRRLPRELAVAPAVQALYLETWDALQAEGSRGT